MTAKGTGDAYSIFLPLMQRFGASCTPEEFYWAVNDAYHACEAKYYDYLHASMFNWLRPMWARNLAHVPERAGLSALDIGSGTGLVGDFLNEILGARVSSLICLDPSRSMQAELGKRAANWAFPTRLIEGRIDDLNPSTKFDVITVNSVLHHVVDLPYFCKLISTHLAKGGVFLTAQDPRAGSNDDEVLRERTQQFAKEKSPTLERCRLRLRRLSRTRSSRRLETEVNRMLAERGIVARSMDLRSIWAVTDVHVPNQAAEIGRGIDLGKMAQWLPGCELLDSYTYQYHGIDWDYLGSRFQSDELRLWEMQDPHGALFGSVWARM
jgi:ubiquinone/menaquinone biosynthesis C-methylase UbiE